MRKLFCILVLLCPVAMAQNKPTVKPETKPDPVVALTRDEQKDIDNLGLRMQVSYLQWEKDKNDADKNHQNRALELQGEAQQLLDSLAKAHKLDPKKYRYDIQKKGFVPIADPAESK